MTLHRQLPGVENYRVEQTRNYEKHYWVLQLQQYNEFGDFWLSLNPKPWMDIAFTKRGAARVARRLIERRLREDSEVDLQYHTLPSTATVDRKSEEQR